VEISCAPLRISLLGGGTDFRSYFERHRGLVFGFSIDKYVYVISHPLPQNSREAIRFTYRVTESVNEYLNLQHPALRAELHKRKWRRRINLATISDLPGNSGLGSSSAFCSALIHRLDSIEGKEISKSSIAQKAIYLERGLLKEYGGEQDQYLTSIGGVNFIEFSSEGTINWEFNNLAFCEIIETHLYLVPLGNVRNSSKYARVTQDNIAERLHVLDELVQIVESFQTYSRNLNNNPEDLFMFLMNCIELSWECKLKLNSKDAFSDADKLISSAINLGALAGKLCGAGGGGYVALFIAPGTASRILEKLKVKTFFRPKVDFNGVHKVTTSLGSDIYS
jgi:D-glycero-alpha-D-manno-heptose-7-phosphate kinase